MGKSANLVGQKFGRLTVTGRLGTNGSRSATWNCLCDCGKKKVVSSQNLRNGHTKSCGCLLGEKGNPTKTKEGVLLYPCSGCGIHQESKYFHRSSSTKTGLQLFCISCTKKNLEEWREKNPEKHKKQWDRSGKKCKKERKRLAIEERMEEAPDGSIRVLCTKCGIKKDSHLFHKSRTSLTGYQPWCIDCQSESRGKWKLSHPEQVKALNKMSRERTKESRASKRLQKVMGITLEEKWKRFEEQGNRCAACGVEHPGTKSQDKSGWCADHNHKTGEFRGVLCQNCNKALGCCKDNTKILTGLIRYLKTHKEKE